MTESGRPGARGDSEVTSGGGIGANRFGPFPDVRHPWERGRLRVFARWEEALRKLPYGAAAPDIVGFLDPADPPLWLAEQVPHRRLWALRPFLGPDAPAWLVVIPRASTRLQAGTPFRLQAPIKTAVRGPAGREGELLLRLTVSPEETTWEETFEEPASRHDPRAALEALADLWRLPGPVVAALLLGIVGAPPWRGRPAGVRTHLVVASWRLRSHRELLESVSRLAPATVRCLRSTTRTEPLELGTGVRLPSSRSRPARPFAIRIARFRSGDGAGTAASGQEIGFWSYGPLSPSDLPGLLASVHVPIMLSASRPPNRSGIVRDVPSEVRSTVWGLRWSWPEPPESPEWHAWRRNEQMRFDAAVADMLAASGIPLSARSAPAIDRRDLWDRLAQAAWAHARLRGASAVGPQDLRRVVDRWVEAAESLRRDGRATHRILSAGGTGSAAARTRHLAARLLDLLRAAPAGATITEIAGEFPARASASELEWLLERLRLRGSIYVDTRGRFHPV